MQSGVSTIGGVDQSAIVNFHIIGFNRDLARGCDLRIAQSMSAIRAVGGRIFVWSRNEVGDFLHGKRIANIEYACPRIEPRKNGQLSVIGSVKRFGHGMRAEPSTLSAKIAGIFRDS